jgi:hypothetical protein
MAYVHFGAPGTILVNTDRLRGLASQLRSMATEMQARAGWLDQAPARIEMQVHQCLVVENDIMRAAALARRLGHQAETLAAYLVGRAQAFDAADAAGVGAVVQLHTAFVAMEQQEQVAAQSRTQAWLEGRIAADKANTGGRESDQCVAWADQRRLSLGGAPVPHISRYFNDLGAKHLADIYRDSGVTGEGVQHFLEHSGQSLDQVIQPGSLIVWDATPGNPYGHVAVVEYVTPDGIWISEQNNPLQSPPHIRPHAIALDQLSDTFVIPPNAQPSM